MKQKKPVYKLKTDDGLVRCPKCHRMMYVNADSFSCRNSWCGYILPDEPPKISINLENPHKLTTDYDSIGEYVRTILEHNNQSRNADHFYKVYMSLCDNTPFYHHEFLKLARKYCRLIIDDDFIKMAKESDKRISKMSQEEIEQGRKEEQENQKKSMERCMGLLENYEKMGEKKSISDF